MYKNRYTIFAHVSQSEIINYIIKLNYALHYIF